MPLEKNITYYSFVYEYHPLFRLIYESDFGAPAASLLENKILIHSVIFDAKHGARFTSSDLETTLAALMLDPESMKIHMKDFWLILVTKIICTAK